MSDIVIHFSWLDILLFLGYFALFFLILPALILITGLAAWRLRRRGKWIWAGVLSMVCVALFTLVIGFPISQNLRFWLAQRDVPALQIVNKPDLTGKVVAINTGWDGWVGDVGSDVDCLPLKLGAARAVALAPVGAGDSRVEGKRIDFSQPADLTAFLGGEMVVRQVTDANGKTIEVCDVIRPAAPARIDYVILKDAEYGRLPDAFRERFDDIVGKGIPRLRLFYAKVDNPRAFSPDPKEADIALTQVYLRGWYGIPFHPVDWSEPVMAWGQSAQEAFTSYSEGDVMSAASYELLGGKVRSD